MLRLLPLLLSIIFFSNAHTQNNSQVFYLNKTTSKEIFNDVKQLSNNNILIAGVCNNLSWVPASTSISYINLNDTVMNNLGSNRIPFLMMCNKDMTQILNLVALNTNDAEDIKFIKFTNEPGTATQQIYISGNTNDTKLNDGGYFIAKLNNNFVNGIPTGFDWASPIYAANGSYIKDAHPWDVNSAGNVYYATGESHAANWAAIHSLDGITGRRRVVENWLTHWYPNPVTGGTTETEYKYAKASTYTGTNPLLYSGIPLKHGRCDLRSLTNADYNSVYNDENGFPKRGKMPFDLLFNSECNPMSPSTSGRGYNNHVNGYAWQGSSGAVMGIHTITCDKRNNWMYIGINTKSRLPDGQPDFEPAVIALNNDEIKWWNRLYKESDDGLNPNVSTPDQYIDAITIDYSKPITNAELIVLARSHGSNTTTLWAARTSSNLPLITANSSAKGVKNRFMGNNGNIHISWLGRFNATLGTLLNVSYVGELIEGATNYGAPSTDLHYDGWPDPNSGNADMNTTYIRKNQVQVTGDGHVVFIGTGRRTFTTANAYQKMPPPSNAAKGVWNEFIREYRADLSYPKYSSIITGLWDQSTGVGNSEVLLTGVCKTADGIISVGFSRGVGNAIPTLNIPTWGNANFNDTTGVIVYLKHDSISSIKDEGIVAITPLSISLDFKSQCIQNKLFLELNSENLLQIKNIDIEFSKNNFEFEKIKTIELNKNKHKIQVFENGYYRLKIHNKNNSIDYKIIPEISCLKNNDIIIFPNPTNNEFKIIGTKNSIIDFEIFDTNKKLVIQQSNFNTNQSIKIKQLPKGIYYIKIINKDSNIFKKLVIN